MDKIQGSYNMIRKVLMAGALLLIGGCGGTPHMAMSPKVERAPQNELPPPNNLGPDGKYLYTLGALDTISIEVDGMPDLLREAIVIDGQGMISYPLGRLGQGRRTDPDSNSPASSTNVSAPRTSALPSRTSTWSPR